MYDVVPVGLYPSYDQKLAMRIGGARFAAEVTIHHWRKLARTSGLDENEVTDVVVGVATRCSNTTTRPGTLSPTISATLFATRLHAMQNDCAQTCDDTATAASIPVPPHI